MGGTSTDVCFIEGGRAARSAERKIGGLPVRLPAVDIHTVGAGGGSIARRDAGGALLVGPESAGAEPGPACYGLGGELPTVTDANLLLGRLPERAGGRARARPGRCRACARRARSGGRRHGGERRDAESASGRVGRPRPGPERLRPRRLRRRRAGSRLRARRGARDRDGARAGRGRSPLGSRPGRERGEARLRARLRHAAQRGGRAAG